MKGNKIIFGGDAGKLLELHAGRFRWTRDYTILGQPVCIRATAAELFPDSLLFFDHFRTAAATSDAAASLEIHLIHDAGSRGAPYKIVFQSRQLLQFPDFTGIETFLPSNIMHHLLGRVSDLTILHAAALEWHGECYLFLGDSGVGKTTFTLALLRRGFGYLSDDLAPITPPALAVLPFPRFVQVRDGTASLLAADLGDDWRTGAVAMPGQQAWLVDPARLAPRLVTDPCPLGYVVFLRRNWGGRSSLEACRAVESLARLVIHWANRYYLTESQRKERLPALAELVSRVPCLELAIGDIGEAACLVTGLAERRCVPEVDPVELAAVVEQVLADL